MVLPSQLTWHVDGHTASFMIKQTEVYVYPDVCPFPIDGPCRMGPNRSCIVGYYIEMFGLEINVGATVVNGPVEFAWAFVGEPTDLELAQVWIIPKEDDVFAPWLHSFLEAEEEE